MYDNETEKFVDLGDLCNNADWYIETDGWIFRPMLYIIPHDPSIDSVAPDDYILDALHYDIREFGKVQDATIEKYGLELVPVPLRRFNEIDGYYNV